MKMHKIYLAKREDGVMFWGTCPTWAEQSRQSGLNVTVKPVAMTSPKMHECHLCGKKHPAMGIPEEVMA